MPTPRYIFTTIFNNILNKKTTTLPFYYPPCNNPQKKVAENLVSSDYKKTKRTAGPRHIPAPSSGVVNNAVFLPTLKCGQM